MAFTVSPRTLEQLDWPELLDRLGACCGTPRGRARAGAFENDAATVRERLAETGEARARLDAGEALPLGGVHDVDESLERAGKGGVLTSAELQELGSTLHALHASARYLAQHAEEAPRLTAWAERIPDLRELEEDIEWSFDAEGEVRDEASPALARARASSRTLAGQLQERLGAYLRDPNVLECLSDSFYTVRNDRYVLPVRSDSRARVRGIVHDASGSGTTLFIEPEAVVELNNRLKQAEIEIEHETLRILRELSERAAAARPLIDAGLDALAALDAAFARGRLSQEMAAVAPESGDEGVLRLPQLRHPLLPAGEVVPNDLTLGDGYHVLVLSGPNAGGKTVAMKALALAVLMVRAGLHVPAAPGARVDLMDAVLADIGDEQSMRDSLSTFSAHMASLARIVNAAGRRSFVALDEVGVGTDPGEGAALAQAALETLADAGARVVTTTHYNLLKEMADVDPRFANASVDFDPETLEPTYRLRPGVPGASSATAVAARMGLARRVLDRANELLEREDRRLDRMLSELAASRATLETERREAGRLRAEGEAAREAYRDKLEKLQKRRDDLFQDMRQELDRAFRGAHEEIAGVIRNLQRGGDARDAAKARERLLELAERQRAIESEVTAPLPETTLPSVDWRRAKPGDAVRIAGGGEGTLAALPDKRGRAAVRVGSARMLVPAERVLTANGGARNERPAPRVAFPAPDGDLPLSAGPCDLRGLRVDEALERVTDSLDRAARDGRARLVIVHGFGTGALRRAVREHLAASAYVLRAEAADKSEGGDGATVAILSG